MAQTQNSRLTEKTPFVQNLSLFLFCKLIHPPTHFPPILFLLPLSSVLLLLLLLVKIDQIDNPIYLFMMVDSSSSSSSWGSKDGEVIKSPSSCDYSFKILLIGDSGVGKSSLLLSFLFSNSLHQHLTPTIGMHSNLSLSFFLFISSYFSKYLNVR